MAKAARTGERTSVWREDRPRRGGRDGRGGRGAGRPSGLDRDRITRAVVRLLDAEGLAGLSMRRLAAELNVTAMSVYWYVDTKDDLLELALDAVHGELRLPDAATDDAGATDETDEAGATDEEDEAGETHRVDDDWRVQVRALAREYRALLVRHPWLSRLAGAFPDIGPRSLDFSRSARHVLGRTGLPERHLAGAHAAVFRFVHGYATAEDRPAARTPAPDFEAALDLIVAGIEATVARSPGVSPRTAAPGSRRWPPDPTARA
ncbi:TetR/AcrR family transcriptional regulator [Streptomyces ziwulingensis]|uniref:TetR/AcrR family transcriptional regulator n=1 Tax=Streptomyces ziwulingensis TaxID=1045501 RepID=A0ABP9CXZ2_9ACTN